MFTLDLPYLSSGEMAEVDRKAPEEYGITVSRMMENAAYQIADYIRRNYEKDRRVTAYAGKGNNGGDALAAARRLHNWGFQVDVVLITRNLDGIRKEELEIIEKLDLNIKTAEDSLETPDIALDGLIGYNIRGNPREPFDKVIKDLNKADEVIAVDLPTGVDPDTGERFDPSVKEDKVLTLGLPKKGLKSLDSDIFLIDISVPDRVYQDLGVKTGNLFSDNSILRLK